MAPTESRGPELIGVAAAFLVLSWIFTILRVYSREIVVRQMGSDGYLAFAAQVCDINVLLRHGDRAKSRHYDHATSIMAVVRRKKSRHESFTNHDQVCFTMMCVSCFIGVHFGIGMKGLDISDVLSGGAVNPVLARPLLYFQSSNFFFHLY